MVTPNNDGRGERSSAHPSPSSNESIPQLGEREVGAREFRGQKGEAGVERAASPDSYALGRPGWFIAVRFVAVAAVVAALMSSRHVFHITRINYPWLWTLALVLLGVNLVYYAFTRWGALRSAPGTPEGERWFSAFITLQYIIDMILLTLLLHFSGGMVNPFFLYYFFHIVLASILLSKRAGCLAAGFAVLLFSGMALLEGTGVIHHYNLFPFTFYSDPLFLAGTITAFASAVFITVYLTVTVTGHLRAYRLLALQAFEEKHRIEMEKAHFLDVVSHDLKSPLAAIETMIASLLSAYGNQFNEDARDTLERIPKRTRDLIRFIQNLLDFSKLHNTDELTVRFKPLNFLPIVTSAVEMYMDQALDKHITMTVHVEPDIPRIMGSGEHLERLVGNLVSNAIRYTSENGSVTVKLGMENGDVVLTVADSGIGIPEKELPRVFDEFFRGSNARTATDSGTGLGLSIARFIAEKHGGAIKVNSVEGEGTIFTVRIPAIIGQ
jgi:signal transduction histidine kinase